MNKLAAIALSLTLSSSFAYCSEPSADEVFEWISKNRHRVIESLEVKGYQWTSFTSKVEPWTLEDITSVTKEPDDAPRPEHLIGTVCFLLFKNEESLVTLYLRNINESK